MGKYDEAIAVLEAEVNGIDSRIRSVHDQRDRQNSPLPMGAQWRETNNQLGEQVDALDVQRDSIETAIEFLRNA